MTSYGPEADAAERKRVNCQHPERQVVGNGIYCQVCGQLVEDLSPDTTDDAAAMCTS